MPVSWRIADGLVWLESDEAATFEKWHGALEAALADPGFRPGTGILHDWRRHRGVLPSAEVLTEPGAALRVFRDPVEAEAWARGG